MVGWADAGVGQARNDYMGLIRTCGTFFKDGGYSDLSITISLCKSEPNGKMCSPTSRKFHFR